MYSKFVHAMNFQFMHMMWDDTLIGQNKDTVVQIHVLHGQIVINEDAMNRAVSQIINIVRETVFEVLAFKSALVVRIIIW